MQIADETKTLKKFKSFLVKTGRGDLKDKIKKTPDCLGIYEHFSVIDTSNPEITIPQLYRANKQFESYRNHAVKCGDCMKVLDARILFPEFDKSSIFSETKKRILFWERNNDFREEKEIYVVQKPAPNYLSNLNSKLVFLTENSIEEGIKEFDKRIRGPLRLPLNNLSRFNKPKLRDFHSQEGGYYSTDANGPGVHIRIVSAKSYSE